MTLPEAIFCLLKGETLMKASTGTVGNSTEISKLFSYRKTLKRIKR